MIEDMSELQSRLDLDAPTTTEELECALSKLDSWWTVWHPGLVWWSSVVE